MSTEVDPERCSDGVIDPLTIAPRAEQNHFELFGLPTCFQLDPTKLRTRYRDLQARLHPDKHVAGTAAERMMALQLSTLANQAYQILSSPLERAAYLLRLHGVTAIDDNSRPVAMAFLQRQMLWHEALADAVAAADTEPLLALREELVSEQRQLQTELVVSLDQRSDHDTAVESTLRLRFIERLMASVDEAIDDLELAS